VTIEEQIIEKIRLGDIEPTGENDGIVQVGDKFYDIEYEYDNDGWNLITHDEVVPIKTIVTEYVSKEEAREYIGMCGFGKHYHVVQNKYIIDEELVRNLSIGEGA